MKNTTVIFCTIALLGGCDKSPALLSASVQKDGSDKAIPRSLSLHRHNCLASAVVTNMPDGSAYLETSRGLYYAEDNIVYPLIVNDSPSIEYVVFEVYPMRDNQAYITATPHRDSMSTEKILENQKWYFAKGVDLKEIEVRPKGLYPLRISKREAKDYSQQYLKITQGSLLDRVYALENKE